MPYALATIGSRITVTLHCVLYVCVMVFEV